MDLFQEKKHDAILLVDRSGSTDSFADSTRTKTIFNRMLEICSQLGHSEYRVIFWNSLEYNENPFINGIMVVPFVVKADALKTVFALAEKAQGGYTSPQIGFKAIKPEWLVNDPMIYLITDGQIEYNNVPHPETVSAIANEIRNLNCQLTIIAVENVVRDFNNLEHVNKAAGGDIYQIIKSEKLTGKVSKFVSYNPNGSFVQIDKVRAPVGNAPFGNKYFSVLRVPEFIEYIKQILLTANESEQLTIAQKLSSTLEVLTKDKPKPVAEDIIRMFSQLFTIDSEMVKYIMTCSIAYERNGQSQLFADYRAQLKNLFAKADGLLKQDVCSAIGMKNSFISPVIANRVLSGSYRLITKNLIIHGSVFPHSGFTLDVPVFPLLTNDNKLTDLQDQCLRQWIRTIYSVMYQCHPTADIIIYLLLGDMCKVCNSLLVSDKIKEGYRQLAKSMLRKKRLNSIRTEMDQLLAGELPIPNSGKFEDFETYMTEVSIKTGLIGKPLKIWYDICSALDPLLAVKQRIHCEAQITPFNNIEVHEDLIPESANLDYSCIVTLDDISLIGGYRIKSHSGPAGQCSPIYLISAEGKRQMIESKQCNCPVCYFTLTEQDFELVGPKIAFNLPSSYSAYSDKFNGTQDNDIQKADSINKPLECEKIVKNSHKLDGIRNANGKTGKIVVMKGVVGCGKSTAAQIIKNVVEARGGQCIVVGTDKYCVAGMSTKNAISQVQNDLKTVSDSKIDDLVVVIDTCGERSNRGHPEFFGVNFRGWQYIEIWPNLDRLNFAGYFAWSLRNVLLRNIPKENDNFYLCPSRAGVDVCIDVHKKKAKSLFKPNEFHNWKFANATEANLANSAKRYAATLQPFTIPTTI